jgi:hypothetical protein
MYTAVVWVILAAAMTACSPIQLFPSQDSQSRPQLYPYSGEGKYEDTLGEIHFSNHGWDYCYDNPPSTVHLGTDERAKYCATYTPQETDAKTVDAFLSQLEGRWEEYIVAADGEVDSGRVLSFSRKQATASLDDQSISFNRVCLSQEITKEDRYSGFRIVELEASNNAGVAIFGVKFEKPFAGHSYPTLWMTSRQYLRFGASDDVQTERSVFCPQASTDDSVSILVFPNH